MEKLVELGLYFEFYKELLTKQQKAILEQYYMQDFSLNEIADNLSISKQGVYDTLQRGERKLYQMENALHLVERFYRNEEIVKQVIHELKDLETISNRSKIKNIIELLLSLQ